MINILKAIGLICSILFILAIITFFFYQSANKSTLNFYSEDKIRITCPDSPEKIYYQECFRKDLSKILSEFSSIDTYLILKTIEESYKLDSYHLKNQDQQIKAFILKYENLIIFAENSKNLTINRNNLSFYTFPLVPIAKFYVKVFFINKIKEFNASAFKEIKLESTNPLSQRLSRVQRRIPTIVH